MGDPQRTVDFDALTPEEQVDHVLDLWERIAADPRRMPVPAEHLEEARRRLADAQADPDSSIPWDDVRRQARARRRS